MLEKQSLSDERIIDCLSTAYGIDVVALTFLPLGADSNASVYKAQARDGSVYFIKVKRKSWDDVGIAVVELMVNAGVQQIVSPLKNLRGYATQVVEDFTLIVYPFVEGQNGLNCSLTDSQWIALGKALRQVHEIELPLQLRKRIRHEMYSSQWREMVKSFYPLLEKGVEGNEIAQRLVVFMKKNLGKIQQLVDGAQRLAQIAQEKSQKFVLCHSDIHGGNVLLTESSEIFIVDWDEPMMAPKERDLMFVGGGVGNVWNEALEEKLFYQGYGDVEVDSVLLSYYRHERIVEDIALFGRDLLLSGDGGDDREMMYGFFVGMFELNGVIDIALSFK